MLVYEQYPSQSLYGRIRDDLRKRIQIGSYAQHEKLPSESELMTQYQVSRITVRQALSQLESEGLLFKVAGKGSFVAKPFQSLARLEGFAEAMQQQGHQITNRLISIETLSADDIVANRLQIAPGQPVSCLQRVRYLDHEPVSLDVTYVPTYIGTRLANEDLAHRDIFLILENDYGLALGHADLAIDAQLATHELAMQLVVDVAAPILRIERLTHTSQGEPIDFEYLYCRADNFQYRLRITR